jgi:hypothetical protein
MRERNAILDMNTLQMHFVGQGQYDLPAVLPPGTESYQLETAPSGHLVLPCCEYAAADRELTFVAEYDHSTGRCDTGPAYRQASRRDDDIAMVNAAMHAQLPEDAGADPSEVAASSSSSPQLFITNQDWYL